MNNDLTFFTNEPNATLLDVNYFLNRGDKYVLAFLISKVGWYLLTKLGTDLRGYFYQLFINMMETLPIFSASDSQKAPIIERVQTILANPDSPDVPCLEAEINKLVYALYSLTPEEIAIVEGKN